MFVSILRQTARAAMLVLALMASRAGPALADGQAMVLPVDPAPLIAETDTGKHAFQIEIADDGQERAAGLMFRNYMADDHGMLFVFEKQQPVGFWMKNTVLPLDLVFIDQDGVVRGVKQGEPLSEDSISPGVPVRFVLELKKGVAAKADIEDGDRISHPRIAQPN